MAARLRQTRRGRLDRRSFILDELDLNGRFDEREALLQRRIHKLEATIASAPFQQRSHYFENLDTLPPPDYDRPLAEQRPKAPRLTRAQKRAIERQRLASLFGFLTLLTILLCLVAWLFYWSSVLGWNLPL
jgi:hypothetical protein